MHRTILAAATPDDLGRAALGLAIALARPAGAHVVLAGIVETHADALRDDGAVEYLLRRLEPLRDAAPSDVPVTIDATAAPSVVRGVHDLAVECAAQLVVLGPSHRGTIGRALHGDTAAGVLFTAPCGVAVATPGPRVHHLRRIGVAWDGTAEADEALEWGVQLAERTAAEVRILHVAEAGHAEGRRPASSCANLLPTLRQAVEPRAAASAELLWGDPGPALTKATQDLDVLVLGSRALSPLRRVLLGSVSHDVLHRALCPIVVLPRGVHAPLDMAAA